MGLSFGTVAQASAGWGVRAELREEWVCSWLLER